MLMLEKTRMLNRVDLATIPTPAPTPTWRPLAHADVANTLIERAEARGLEVRKERYTVLSGAYYVQPGMKAEVKGARLFGTLDFAPIPGMTFPEGCTPSAGLRNSHDKSFALSILAGARVLVCSNGVLSAEHVVTRKHTSRIDLRTEIDRALDAFLHSLGDFNTMHERMRNRRLTITKAHSLVIEMARSGAISSSQILPTVREFEQPRHAQFRDRNAWSLYQAATEVMKVQSPGRQVEGYKALNQVLLPMVN